MMPRITHNQVKLTIQEKVSHLYVGVMDRLAYSQAVSEVCVSCSEKYDCPWIKIRIGASGSGFPAISGLGRDGSHPSNDGNTVYPPTVYRPTLCQVHRGCFTHQLSWTGGTAPFCPQALEVSEDQESGAQGQQSSHGTLSSWNWARARTPRTDTHAGFSSGQAAPVHPQSRAPFTEVGVRDLAGNDLH